MGGVLRLALAHLVGDRRRAVAAGLAILVAVTSFVVLTGTVSTQRLQVRQEVASNYRSTYDILVRPQGSKTTLEESDGLVRPNFLAGQYGGISLGQVDQIRAVPGVEVAAPVAVLGQTMRSVLLSVDIKNVLGSRDSAMVRFSLSGTARNATATTTNQRGYLYLTRRPLITIDSNGDGESVPSIPAQVERRNGRTITACLASNAGGPATSPATAFQQHCWSTRDNNDAGAQPPRVETLFSLPLTVEAIDPDAEAKLTGLNQAIESGRGLEEADSFGTDTQGPAPIEAATAVMASQLPFDFKASLQVDELSPTTTEQVLASDDAATRARLVATATPVRTVGRVDRDAAAVYRSDIAPNADTATASADQSLIVFGLDQPGQVDYTSTNPLSPRVVPFDATPWRSDDGFLAAPPSLTDTGYRPSSVKTKSRQDTFVSFKVVGTYDPDRLPKPSTLNEVPLETYRPSYVEGADAASRTVLGDKPMLSDLNPAGYVQSPPALLVPLAALPLFADNFADLNTSAPVSSVRVRVADVNGLDPVAREKIRQIAEQIQTETGLDVDITIGSSLQNREVNLPASTSGTPALQLNERWTKKGVAVAVSNAIDTKSLVLFVVILASAALTVTLIATASVQARRRDLAVLACLGWPAGRRRTLIAAELTIIGVGAGLLGALLSWPLAHALHIHTDWWQTVLAVPLGALLALLPGLAATITAGQVAPIDAFRPRTSAHRQASLILRGPATLGCIMTSRRPGRAVLASLAVALAVASATLVTTIATAFNGAVIGSFLGDAVALQVRTPDIVATVLLAVLGLTAVTTVLLLALTEDAPNYAMLQAAGWTDIALTRTLLTQAGVVGLAGATLGCVAALTTTALFIGPLTHTAVGIAALVFFSAVAASSLAALIPAAITARLPTARILARE